MNTKRTFDEIIGFLEKWKKNPIDRLGQHFCNTFNITDSKIFYEENSWEAERMIWKDYYNPDWQDVYEAK